jgi:hypothetical protein
MGDQGHLVPTAAQFTGQQINDALDIAIDQRRNGQFGSAVRTMRIRRSQ